MFVRLAFVAFAAVLMLSACSGPSATENGDGEATAQPAPEPAETRPPVDDYETFDASRYPVRPPVRDVEINHEVPARLLQGDADEGVRRTMEGFRIQVFSAQDQEAAQNFRERVRKWWEENADEAPESLLARQPTIDIEYSQPYYRVRFGAFGSREPAEEALAFVQENFPDAFLARSTVTVTR